MCPAAAAMTAAAAELSQSQSEVVYSPRSSQVLKFLLNWLAFFFQIFLQILRGTVPSMAQILFYKPLPAVELPQRCCSPHTMESATSDCEIGCCARRGGDNNAVVHACDGGNAAQMDKFTVVLDLDETLVCAYETCSLPAIVRNQATEAGLNWFELECISSDKEFEGKPKINYVTVFERPGLEEFLKELSGFADLVLFTAGLEGYARPLVDRIDVKKRFGLRLYRPSTTSTQYRDHVKDLSCLSRDLSRTVIVDNNPFSFLLQPLNGIPCIPFTAGQPHDVQLLEVILPLLRHLSQQHDVRPVLYEKFLMPEWFQKHGIAASSLT